MLPSPTVIERLNHALADGEVDFFGTMGADPKKAIDKTAKTLGTRVAKRNLTHLAALYLSRVDINNYKNSLIYDFRSEFISYLMVMFDATKLDYIHRREIADKIIKNLRGKLHSHGLEPTILHLAEGHYQILISYFNDLEVISTDDNLIEGLIFDTFSHNYGDDASKIVRSVHLLKDRINPFYLIELIKDKLDNKVWNINDLDQIT